MKPDEQGNEDIMKEAVSLIQRIEFRLSSRPELAVLGFNSLGWLSVYLGSDPMYRFDELGRLRRAFVDGMLFRTDGTTLAMMERHSSRSPDDRAPLPESALLRRDLSHEELNAFRDRMRTELNELRENLDRGEITRQHPPEMSDAVSLFERGLEQVLNSEEFLAPAIVDR